MKNTINYKDEASVLQAFLDNNPHKIEGSEIDAWCGLEGNGYISYFGEAECVVIDISEDRIYFGYYYCEIDPDEEANENFPEVELTRVFVKSCDREAYVVGKCGNDYYRLVFFPEDETFAKVLREDVQQY